MHAAAMSAVAAALLLVLADPAAAVEVRSPPGALHGFPSNVRRRNRTAFIAMVAPRRSAGATRLFVDASWVRGGRRRRRLHDVPARARARAGAVASGRDGNGESSAPLRGGLRRRRCAGRASPRIDARRGASAGAARAASGARWPVRRRARGRPARPRSGDEARAQPSSRSRPAPGDHAGHEIRDEGQQEIRRQRRIDRPYGIASAHPGAPLLVRPFVHPHDALLSFTHGAPRALVRARAGARGKGRPRSIIDVIPRGAVQTRSPSAPREPTSMTPAGTSGGVHGLGSRASGPEPALPSTVGPPSRLDLEDGHGDRPRR